MEINDLRLRHRAMGVLSTISESMPAIPRIGNPPGRTTDVHGPVHLTQSQSPKHGSNGTAATLQHLRTLELPSDLNAAMGLTNTLSGTTSDMLQHLHQTWCTVERHLRPQGCCDNDRTLPERIINVVTSLPFAWIGLHSLRHRQSSEGRAFGASMVAVGAVATAYHASSGPARVWLRRLDYWTISWSASCLTRALHPASQPVKHLSTVSLALVPFRPLPVTAANIVALEADFARYAHRHPEVRSDYLKHLASTVVGGTCFALEDVALNQGCIVLHSVWHLLSCAAAATASSLVGYKERQEGVKPLQLRPVTALC